MESIRCACRAMLLRARADAIIEGVEVKCRKCGRLNVIHQRAAQPGRESPSPERHGASQSEDV